MSKTTFIILPVKNTEKNHTALAVLCGHTGDTAYAVLDRPKLVERICVQFLLKSP